MCASTLWVIAETDLGLTTAELVSAPELNHLDWGHRTRRFAALGHDFAVRTTNPSLGRYLDQLLGAFAVSGMPKALYSLVELGEPASRFELFLDEQRLVAATARADVAVQYLLWHLSRRAVETAAHQVVVHAAVAEQSGAAILLVGPSGAGKSTLVAALVARGCRYLTDEAAAIDPSSLLVQPFPKPIKLQLGSVELLASLEPAVPPDLSQYFAGQWQVDPRSIRSTALADAAPPRWVFVISHRRDAPTELVEMRPAEALMALATNAFDLRRHGKPGLELLATLVRRSRHWRLVVGDLDEACGLVLALAGLEDAEP